MNWTHPFALAVLAFWASYFMNDSLSISLLLALGGFIIGLIFSLLIFKKAKRKHI
ncbi:MULTISPECIES: hypothetical protein [Cytobacillus]|uniref:hypothetical protein n=1 Tax=Cytobacillus TaxID=2675230 RepID=UPI001CD24070|nr:hypothetical protein [Cytobacillus kochii]MCA1024832.1 hypothetical protein [Cytobacillus kochii]MCM3323685.1 hypothetical protein [Cytobacillus kochii]MCM3346134.1 hypothetical protein [Cytobacillus kochii]MDM5206523.1 hypothetical protein [Cytobacillus kochii]MDQ0188054.1 membrane associated rhomboid family serine protease [Cytobacillus kochii]